MEELARAIILQALDDYKYLVDNGVESAFSKKRYDTGELRYSRKEIEAFLRSDWRKKLFAFLGHDLNASILLDGLRLYARRYNGCAL